MTHKESTKIVKLIEFETDSSWVERRKKIFINPLQVTSLEQGNIGDSTIISMINGCAYHVFGDVTEVMARITEGGAA